MINQTFIKTTKGEYKLSRPVSEKEIIEKASELLYQELQTDSFSSSEKVKTFFAMKLNSEVREHFGVLYLDAQHRVLHFAIEFSGTVDGAAIYPRILLQNALKLGTCCALVVGHNHPSGSLEFSQADRNITKQIKNVLELCDIRLLDSVLVSKEGAVSAAERGLL